MSIIKPIKPVIQERRRRGVEDTETEKDQKLSKQEIRVVAGAGVGGLTFLFLIAWLLLPFSVKILPFVVAGALPLFTLYAVIYQAIVYRRQWNVMQKSLRQTAQVIEQMQAQLRAVREQTDVMQNTLSETQKMVKHSERGVEIAERNMKYAQRAYVSVTKRGLSRGSFVIDIENTGNSPAREVSIQWVIDAGMMPPELPKLDDQVFTQQIAFLGLLAPRSPERIVIPFNRDLTAKEATDYREYADLFHWWVRGVIMYQDIFHESISDYRLTNFCLFFDQNAQAVRAHSSGNEEEEYEDGKRINTLKRPAWWPSPPN